MQDFSESDQLIKTLHAEITSLRSEYVHIKKLAEDARNLFVDTLTYGLPWNIESLAWYAVFEHHLIEVAVRMVNKYLKYIDGFLSRTLEEKVTYMSELKESGAPSVDFQFFWNKVIFWQNEVNTFSGEEPETVRQVNDKIDGYKKRIDALRQSAAQ